MIAVVIALGLLCLANLVLTTGLVRRINEHTTVLDRIAGEPPVPMRPVGAVVDDFAATAADGNPVSLDVLGAPIVVGFFSPGCGGCHEQLPDFAARARRAPAGRTLAVVVDPDGTGQSMAASLAGSALVVVEQRAGALASAFGVRGFPAFALVGAGGRIEASSSDLASIPILVGA